MKNIKKIILSTFSIVAVSAAVTSFAAIPNQYGWYVEGNVGKSKNSSVNYGSGTKISSWGAGWNFNGGYKFQQFFAAEVGYTTYANSSIKNSAGVKAAKATHYAFDIAGKGILPIAETGLELIGKLGASLVRERTTISNPSAASSTTVQQGSHRATGIYLGAGADYAFTPCTQLVLQWQRAYGNSNTGALDLYSLGIGYNFG